MLGLSPTEVPVEYESVILGSSDPRLWWIVDGGDKLPLIVLAMLLLLFPFESPLVKLLLLPLLPFLLLLSLILLAVQKELRARDVVVVVVVTANLATVGAGEVNVKFVTVINFPRYAG